MTKSQAKVGIAELSHKDQSIGLQIAELRNAIAALDVQRQVIRREIGELRVFLTKSQEGAK